MKRIAADLAKSVYQVTESVRFGQVVQRERLNREAFRRYIQDKPSRSSGGWRPAAKLITGGGWHVEKGTDLFSAQRLLARQRLDNMFRIVINGTQ